MSWGTEAQLRAMLRNREAWIKDEPRPRRPPGQRGLAADLLPKLQRLARAHGWKGMDTYNALGPDSGLQCILVREVVIFADIKDEGEPLTDMQQHWQQDLQAAGQEVYTWTMADWETIQARLSRARR